LRSYDQGRRRISADLTRHLVLQSARELLAAAAPGAAFTVDAVAARAGVSRATVFNLFEGKQRLVHALFDEISARAELMDVDALLTQDDARAALHDYIRRFAAFYDTERVLLRKLRALAALDAELAGVVQARDDKRLAGLRHLVDRLDTGPAAVRHRTADMLKALLVLEVFESLAGPRRSLLSVSEAVIAMAEAVLDRSE
jgi:AcrR family transcriptional regulator